MFAIRSNDCNLSETLRTNRCLDPVGERLNWGGSRSSGAMYTTLFVSTQTGLCFQVPISSKFCVTVRHAICGTVWCSTSLHRV